MLVTLNEVLKDAKRNQYAVGLFNTVNLEMARGVIAAAEEARSPVIIGTAEVLLPYAPLEELSWLLVPMAKAASVPVVLHYDHGLTESMVMKAIRLGFSSVMYDCSSMSYEDNIDACRNLTKFAHLMGVSVEAELGHVGANDAAAESAGGDESIYTEVEQAAEYVARTGVDALAVAIGTAHGAYKARPKLDFNRLSDIAAAVETPLVLHGGSGLSSEDFRKCIKCGISKVNIFTDINCAAAKGASEIYTDGCGMTDLMPEITERIRKAVLCKMEVFGSVGKA